MEESREISVIAAGGRSAKPGVVAKPGMVGFLSVQACVLFAG